MVFDRGHCPGCGTEVTCSTQLAHHIADDHNPEDFGLSPLNEGARR